VLTGGNLVERCVVLSMSGFDGVMFNCGIGGPLVLSGNDQASLLDCYSLVAGGGANQTPDIDFNGSGSELIMRNWAGGARFINKSGSDVCSVDLNSGQIVVDDTCNGTGAITLRGIGKWTNENTYAGAAPVVDELLKSQQLRELYTLLGLQDGDKVTITPAGVTTEQGSFTITFTGDGINTTTQDRTA